MLILILSLAFALLVAVFAVQNANPVAIQFFWTEASVPLVLVILGSALAGAVVTLLLALWREFRSRRKRLNAPAPAKNLKATTTTEAGILNGEKAPEPTGSVAGNKTHE